MSHSKAWRLCCCLCCWSRHTAKLLKFLWKNGILHLSSHSVCFDISESHGTCFHVLRTMLLWHKSFLSDSKWRHCPLQAFNCHLQLYLLRTLMCFQPPFLVVRSIQLTAYSHWNTKCTYIVIAGLWHLNRYNSALGRRSVLRLPSWDLDL